MKTNKTCSKILNDLYCTLFCSISIIICLLSLQSCTSKKERIKQQEIISQKSEEEKQKTEKEKRIKVINEQDSIAEDALILKYHPLSNFDTLDQIYSFKIRELFESYSNLIGLEGEILDLDQINKKNIVTIELSGINGIGKFYCNTVIFQRIIQKTSSERIWNDGYFIIKVSNLIPLSSKITTRIDDINITPSEDAFTEDDLANYVNIDLRSSSWPFYIFSGEIIDFYLK